MGQALYRKYRPKSLKEIVGQEHITRTLEQALKSGRISHAYLFTGPRGTGKTSIARILAHEINSLPYTDDSAHMDIIEIDAASNRRIDEIRELRERVYVAPTSAQYKVYIIDEVHMLTKEAFNALLKTLEEPPAHVVFILATTDVHKLPDTIISRTQRFTFKPAEKSTVVEYLRHIARDEKITVSDTALELLAEHGDGSFRDSVGLLDQASNQGHDLDVSDVQALLGIPPEGTIDELVAALQSHEAPLSEIAQTMASLYEQGYQATSIARRLAARLREQLLDNPPNFAHTELLKLLSDLIAVPIAHDPERYLEIVLLRASLPLATPEQKTPGVRAAPAVSTQPDTKAPETTPRNKTTATATTIKPAQTMPAKAETVKITADTPQGTATSEAKPLNNDSWPEVLSALKQKYNTLYGVVRMAQTEFLDDNNLRLSFAFAFHQKRLSEAKNQQLLATIIEQITGRKVTIECVLDKAAIPAKPVLTSQKATPVIAATDLSTISNIFGGGELLES